MAAEVEERKEAAGLAQVVNVTADHPECRRALAKPALSSHAWRRGGQLRAFDDYARLVRSSTRREESIPGIGLPSLYTGSRAHAHITQIAQAIQSQPQTGRREGEEQHPAHDADRSHDEKGKSQVKSDVTRAPAASSRSM